MVSRGETVIKAYLLWLLIFASIIVPYPVCAASELYKAITRNGVQFNMAKPVPEIVLFKMEYKDKSCHGALDVTWDVSLIGDKKNRATAKLSGPLNCFDGQYTGLKGYAIDMDGLTGFSLVCLAKNSDGNCIKAELKDHKSFSLILIKDKSR